MYYIAVEEHFEAAHFLREYEGKCERLHGHRFKVVVRLKAKGLDVSGMAYDFTLLKDKVRELLHEYDHHHLNEVPPFNLINPTSENIARTIFDKLDVVIRDKVTLDSVEVWESPTSCAIYKP